MINKIKDFLKNKLGRKSADIDSYDQDELLDQEIPDEELAHTDSESNENIEEDFSDEPPELTRTRKQLDDLPNEEPETTQFPPEFTEPKPSLKDKVSHTLVNVRTKLNANTSQWKMPNAFKPKGGKESSLISPGVSNGIEKFLSRQNRSSIHQVSLFFIICGVTYTLGKVTALALRGAPVVDSPRDYAVTVKMDQDFNAATLAQVKNINIFRTNTGLGSKKKAAPIRCDIAQQPSNLPIKVFNTVVLQDTIKSIASVQVRGDRDLQEVRIGDQISNLAKIFKIDRLEILIRNLQTGICESIASDKALEGASPISVMSPSQSRSFIANKKLPGIENEGNKFKIQKALIDDKMKDIASVLTQARAIKIQNPDGTIAFKLTEIDPEGIFPYLGLQDQDIITSINGKSIYDMNEVMGLFSKIKNLDNLQLGIKREGSDSIQEYSIKK